MRISTWGSCNRREPSWRADRGEYPARTAARVAFGVATKARQNFSRIALGCGCSGAQSEGGASSVPQGTGAAADSDSTVSGARSGIEAGEGEETPALAGA